MVPHVPFERSPDHVSDRLAAVVSHPLGSIPELLRHPH